MQMISADGDEYEMFKGHSALDDIAMLENLLVQMVDFGVSPDGETDATAYDATTEEDWSPQEVIVYLLAKYGAKIHGDDKPKRAAFGSAKFLVFRNGASAKGKEQNAKSFAGMPVIGEFEASPTTMKKSFVKVLSAKGLLPRRDTYEITAEIHDPYSGVYCVTLMDKKTGQCLFSARSGIPEMDASRKCGCDRSQWEI
jgi:hypothetical protein